jgi:hypothetical protein
MSITPFDFSMGIQAMTIEKLQFVLLAVFIIGPADSLEALEKYAVLLTVDLLQQLPKAQYLLRSAATMCRRSSRASSKARLEASSPT